MTSELFTIGAIGCLLGRLSAGWAASMLDGMNCGGLLRCSACEGPVSRRRRWLSLMPLRCSCGIARVITWHIGSTIGLGLLFTLFAWCLLSPDVAAQAIHEVRPDGRMLWGRLPFHLTLIFLLWVATLTDLLDYVIPDEVIYPGILIAVVSAFVVGELQMIHIWVNWDEAYVSLYGPYLPEWMKNHHHLHGLAWSVAGCLTGASITWLIRDLSGRILGQPALGGGDVTLMALIGAFLGWQPTLCVLAIAPLAGILVGTVVRLFTGRTFVAYGPYLACSACIVMCTWRWMWADYLTLRDIFGHWPSVAGLIAFAFASMAILLLLLRLFRALPTESMRR